MRTQCKECLEEIEAKSSSASYYCFKCISRMNSELVPING